MSLEVRIGSGEGAGPTAAVDDSRGLRMSMHPDPPLTPQLSTPFFQNLTDDGLITGSDDMRVDGSSTPVEFWIPAHSTSDRWIRQLSILIEGSGATLARFAGLTALTNGCQISWENATGTVNVGPAFKSNWEMIRLCGGTPAFGDGNSAFQLNNVIGAADAYFQDFDLVRRFGGFGLKLDAGSTQRLVLTVSDNLSAGINTYNIGAYGHDRAPA